MFHGLTPPYATIVADPPWQYQKAPRSKQREDGPKYRGRQAEDYYSTMTNDQIATMPVGELAAETAHLFMWVTNPGMFGGRFSRVTPRDIVEAWGFSYQTLLTWVKTSDGAPTTNGMGWYFRGCTEHVVYATRGDAHIEEHLREPNVIMAARGGHSEKPAAFGDLVERVCPGPYLELFARAPRLGWDSWGHGYEQVASLR